MYNIRFEILNLFFSYLLILCQSQELTVEYSNSVLPTPNYCHRPYYDGQDSIYVFGGCSSETERQVLKYSLLSDTIIKSGSLPVLFAYGSIQTDNKGNLFLFGAGNDYNQILKYNMETNTSSAVADIPWNIMYKPTVSSCNLSKNTVLILGVFDSPDMYKILEFDMDTYDIVQSAKSLPISLYYSTAICGNGRAFVFPFRENGNRSVWELDTESHDLFRVGQPNLPIMEYTPSSVSDGSVVYVIAGLFPNQSPEISHEGILRFDPGTNSTEFVQVANWPVKDGERFFLISPQCVYVGRLSRIYCFGGRSRNLNGTGDRTHDEIFFIDMNGQSPTTTTLGPTDMTTTVTSTTTMNPDFFTCANRTDGFYPHPTDCSLYIGCHDEEMDHFACFPPMLYNPISGFCDLPEFVDCGTSCIGKQDGAYPHPHDCSLYILCHSEVMTVAKCFPPLLWDPILSVCNYPDSVSCSN